MVSIYKLKEMLQDLECVSGALDGDPESELDGAGEQLAEQIREFYKARFPSTDTRGVQSASENIRNEDGSGEDEQGSGDSPIFQFLADPDLESKIAKLAGACGDRYRRLTLLRGVDALGYYLTFHQKQYQWGIYLPISGIAWVYDTVFGGIDTDIRTKLTLSANLILWHERFHFAADYATAQMEFAMDRAIYWPARRSGEGNFKLLEEKAANAFMLRKLRWSPLTKNAKGFYPVAKEFSRKQPPGYRDAHEIVDSRAKFDSAVLEHAQEVLNATPGLDPRYGMQWQRLYPLDSNADMQSCPVHLVGDEGRFELPEIGLRLIQSVVVSEETPRFAKQLRALGMNIVTSWYRAKEKLSVSVQISSLDFKQWKPGGPNCFSVRVTGSHRAHLLFQPERQCWIAAAIGDHKDMGHG